MRSTLLNSSPAQKSFHMEAREASPLRYLSYLADTSGQQGNKRSNEDRGKLALY